MRIEVLRGRDGSFDPRIVRKRKRRLDGIDEIVLSLTARGLTTGEVSAHFGEVYGAEASKDTIRKITDKMIEGMSGWQNRPLDRGRFLVIVANPDCRDSGCRVEDNHTAPVVTKCRSSELIRQGWKAEAASVEVSVSPSAGSLWLTDADSVKVIDAPISSRDLSQNDQIEIAGGLAAGEPVKGLSPIRSVVEV